MPMISILVLAGIVAAFATFGIVLAWGERQTRHLNRQETEPAQARKDDLKKAA
jgi:hypothetical protein